MRILFFTNFLFFTLINAAQAADSNTLSDQADRINYSIGQQIGNDFKRQNIVINEQAIRQGIQDGESNTPPLIDKKEMTSALSELKKNITEKMKKEANERILKRREAEKEIRARGTDFMQANMKNEGVITMPGGLQYKILTEGKGLKPKAEDFVTFHYTAKTIEGKEFDSSYKKGKPVTYRANGVLPGFTEAVQMMKPGAKWELYIPPEQAYGRQGPLAQQTIILEIELLSIGE